MDLQSFWLPSTTTSDIMISSFNEWNSVSPLYTPFSQRRFGKTPLGVLRVSTNRTIPIGFVSGLANLFNHHSVRRFACALEDTITVHTVASLRSLRGLRFLLPTHLDRIIVITPHLSLSALPHINNALGRIPLYAVFILWPKLWTLLWSRRID